MSLRVATGKVFYANKKQRVAEFGSDCTPWAFSFLDQALQGIVRIVGASAVGLEGLGCWVVSRPDLETAVNVLIPDEDFDNLWKIFVKGIMLIPQAIDYRNGILPDFNGTPSDPCFGTGLDLNSSYFRIGSKYREQACMTDLRLISTANTDRNYLGLGGYVFPDKYIKQLGGDLYEKIKKVPDEEKAMLASLVAKTILKQTGVILVDKKGITHTGNTVKHSSGHWSFVNLKERQTKKPKDCLPLPLLYLFEKLRSRGLVGTRYLLDCYTFNKNGLQGHPNKTKVLDLWRSVYKGKFGMSADGMLWPKRCCPDNHWKAKELITSDYKKGRKYKVIIP
jgi:hypothetical protein